MVVAYSTLFHCQWHGKDTLVLTALTKKRRKTINKWMATSTKQAQIMGRVQQWKNARKYTRKCTKTIACYVQGLLSCAQWKMRGGSMQNCYHQMGNGKAKNSTPTAPTFFNRSIWNSKPRTISGLRPRMQNLVYAGWREGGQRKWQILAYFWFSFLYSSRCVQITP